jgi:superoxide dismutase, Cu-Zn family
MQKSTLALTTALVFVFVYSVSAMQHEKHAQSQPSTQASTQPAMKHSKGKHPMGGMGGHSGADAHAKQMASINDAVAVMVPTEGSTAHGTVRFQQADDAVTITADIAGLEPGSTHAIHVHQFGDITGTNGKSAGGHYNPMGHDHGLPEQDSRHAGDLGNLTADDAGNAHLVITVKNLSVAGRHNPVIGRGVIVHAMTDDGGQPTGNAGARLAMGVIGIAKSE